MRCKDCRCFLQRISRKDLDRLQSRTKAQALKKRQILFGQGDRVRGWYSICGGFALLYSVTRSGKRISFGIVGPGDLLGLAGLWGERYHRLYAEALSTLRVQYFSFSLAEDGIPCGVLAAMLPFLAEHIRWLRQQRLLVSPTASVKERLAGLLLELHARYGRSREPLIPIRLTCELLGYLLDSHRSTVNLALQDLSRDKLIVKWNGYIKIIDEKGLYEKCRSLPLDPTTLEQDVV